MTDRVITWAGAIPLETDVLRSNKFAMVGIAKLAAAMLGTSTIVNGLACVPTGPATLTVNVNPGEIYSLVSMDATAYSSVAADTAHQILKSGILLDAVNLSCPAPGTAGNSINYLVQAIYQDQDGDSVVLPYYNASNPPVAWSGPNNTGTPNFTTRKGIVTLSAKAGASATTGSQTTPAPDAGYTGLWVVTVANGQSTITAGNIAQYAGAPILPSSLLASIQSGNLSYAVATGTANAHVVALAPALQQRIDGMVIRYKASAANTGAVTLNDGLGAVSVLGGNHAALQGGEYITNGDALVEWNGSIGGGSYILLECTGGALQVAPATQLLHAPEAGQVQRSAFNYAGLAGGTANALTATLSVAPGNYTDWLVTTARVAANNTGGTSLNVNGLGVIPVIGGAHQPLQGGELVAGGFATFAYSTNYSEAILLESTGGAMQVGAATASQHAVQFGQVAGVAGSVRNLLMSVAAASASATLTADEIIVESALGGLRYCLANFSQSINLGTTGAGGMDTGTAPVSGYVALYAIYKPSTATTSILATNATSAVQPTIYGGANMPSGYTASALVSVWPTNGSSQFVVGYQRDRQIVIAQATGLSTSTSQSTATALSIPSIVPKNATKVSGNLSAGGNASASATLSVAANPAMSGAQSIGVTVSSGGSNAQSAFNNLPMLTAQTIYYTAVIGSGTPTYTITINGYEF